MKINPSLKFRSALPALLASAVLINSAMAAVSEADHANTFPEASDGYQAFVPAASVNLLADPTTVLTLSGGAPDFPTDGGGGTSTDYAALVDGSFGLVPHTGGGGPGEVAIRNNWILTYTFSASHPINAVDVFTGWGDGGRMQQDYTVSYATAAAPSTFITLKAVAYHPGGNSAWVSLTTPAIADVIAVRFSFGAQQNGYVGFTELAVQSTAPLIITERDHAASFVSGTPGYQPFVPNTALNYLADPGTVLTRSGGAPANPLGENGTSTAWSTLADGLYGNVPSTGGGPAAVAVHSNWVLTYTFPAGRTVNTVDIFTGWSDDTRYQQDYSVSYALASAPTSFLPFTAVAYHPTGSNGAWVSLTSPTLANVAAVRFAFNTQQGGYVGFNELSVRNDPPPTVGEVDHAASFAAGSTGYQSDIPGTAVNFLADPATVLAVSGTAPADPLVDGTGDRATDATWASLTDGSFGLVPATGGGGPGEVAIHTGYTLTYTLPTPRDVSGIDIFTGWGDSGRFQQDLNVNYSTAADPDIFIPLPPISYHPAGNSTWVHLTILGLKSVASIQFAFGTQQNGYVGYTELAVTGPKPDTDHDNLPDEWELAKAGNLTDLNGLKIGPGPGADSGNFDADSLTDAQEFAASLTYPDINPKLADSDADGVEDGVEVNGAGLRAPTNPTNADTDGDGLSDGVESNSGTYVNAGNPGTSATAADSDGDSFPDGYEAQYGSNPLDIASVPTLLPAGIALGRVTDEPSTGITGAVNFTHVISGGGAAVINGVNLDGLTPTVTPQNFTWETAGAKNIITPIRNENWDPSAGNVTGDGNLQMFGGFTYSNGTPGDSQRFTLQNLVAGRPYELRLFIRKWADDTIRPESLKFTNGAAVTNFFILEDRAGTMFGDDNDNTAYYIKYTYTAQATSLIIDATVPNVAGASGSYHLYGLTNSTTAPPPSLDFTSIVRAPDGAAVTLTFQSRPGHTYAVDYSTQMKANGVEGGWTEITPEVISGGSSTVYEDTVASGLPGAFYRVRDVTPSP